MKPWFATQNVGRRLSAAYETCDACVIGRCSTYVVQDNPLREETRCDRCGHLMRASGAAAACADCGTSCERDTPIDEALHAPWSDGEWLCDVCHARRLRDAQTDTNSPLYDELVSRSLEDV